MTAQKYVNFQVFGNFSVVFCLLISNITVIRELTVYCQYFLMFYGQKLCEEFIYLGKWSLCIWNEYVYSAMKEFINDRPSWLIDWQFVRSSVYCCLSCLLLQLLKRLLLKYSVNVMALSISCFILVRLPHAFWSYRIVCQCLGLLSVYGSNSSVTIYNNIPVLRVKALMYVWTGSQNGSAWSFVSCF